MVVFQGAVQMKNCNKKSQPVDWERIFKARPDLEPPGYKETVRLAKLAKEQSE